MEKSPTFSLLCVGLVLLDAVNSFPIDISSVGEGVSNPIWLTNYLLTGIGFFLIVVSIFFGCVCCRNGTGFKEFRNSNVNLNISQAEGFVNPTINSEVTIFPPLGANVNEICRFEPLPDIKFQAQNLRPAAFSYTEQEISSQDWFFDPYNNFPRNQLKYVQEYGRGWFGRVVEGEAQNITPEEKVTKVMVKILHEDATPTDHMYFLHEVKFYRDLKHPNILRLLGRCLETEPFLIILECYPNGDLKTFLSQNLASAQALVEQGVTLQMCSNITSGLQFMHDNKFIHTDLAARNCLVGPDLSVKIGDYGNSIEIFKSDYYCAGSVALPVRWCAPETLKCTDITIETREVTPPANIWSLGVVFWEICEFCKLPYADLNDDQVIIRVLGEKNYFLEKPKMRCLHKDEMYHLMKLCWKPPVQRPTASQICVVLNNLISSGKICQKEVQVDSKRISQDFEQRWQNLKPNSIPKKDNAIKADHSPPVECSNISSKLKNAKIADSSYVDSPLGIFMSSKNSGQESPRLCLKADKKSSSKIENDDLLQEISKSNNDNLIIKEKSNIDFESGNNIPKQSDKIEFDYLVGPKINPLEKIKGTENEMDSWLKGVEINNEEDESFVRKISEAIRDLDATLAMEKTSSSEENSEISSRQNSPGKDIKETNEPVVDFKLGQQTSTFMNFTQKNFEISSLQNSEQPQSLDFTEPFLNKKNEKYGPDSLIMPFIQEVKCKGEVLDESLKENDSLLCGQSRNSSDTDDEIWRRRIEKGEISEKVKEKSKSIANLMILTHIDSDDSDIDFDKPFERGLNRSSFIRRSGSFAKSSLSSNNFGSENDLTYAVLEDEFKESLKKLTNDHKEHGHFDSLGVILPSSANRENVWESLFKPSDPPLTQTDVNIIGKDSESGAEPATNPPIEKIDQNIKTNGNNFLGNVASEKFETKEGSVAEGKAQDCASSCKSSLKKDCLGDLQNIVENNQRSNCTANQQNSSHVKGSDVSVNSACEDSASEKPEDESLPLERNSRKAESMSAFLDDGNLASLSKENDQQNNVGLRLESDSVSQSSVDFQPVKKNFRDTESLNETVQQAEVDMIENCYPVLPENCSKNFTKDILIPDIMVTEEPHEEPVKEFEYENKKFEFEKPNLRALKFVLKDGDFEPSTILKQIKPKPAADLESFSFSSINDNFFTKNLENDFGRNIFENATVIVGASEDFTMDYFKGLKTTSEDINVKNNMVIDTYENDEENLDVWDKHLEKAFSQQLSNTNFDDISFRIFNLESAEDQDLKEIAFEKNNSCTFPLDCIADFIESEKLHTEKLEETIQINRLTSLSVMSNEEEYEPFKLRTPDDERSSDSGFRDKGSLSESVEDACEGKYNLEDIEAELEEAFMKGVFGNCEADKDKDSTNDSKNSNNFEYEESKFYEDGSKNEEDFSDIDGEIEFWHNKDEVDYYPEISEFHPTFSEGWYLHPPDDSMLTFDSHVNEDLVNALRNELRENLPIQSRSFDEYNDLYETEIEGAKRDLNNHYGSEFGLPLSPIFEEQDSASITLQKNLKNSLLDANNANRVRKNVLKLMDSVKAVDTNSFMQYLDYMIESEGRNFYEIEEIEENVEKSQKFNSTVIIPPEKKESEDIKEYKNSISYTPDEQDFTVEKPEVKDDILTVNLETNKVTLVEKFESEPFVIESKDDQLEIITDNSENDGLVFTPQMLSPDRERSLSEISRTGDALSEITMSSPDLVPDCFSASVQEIEGEGNFVETKNKLNSENPEENNLQTQNHFLINERNNALEKTINLEENKLESGKSDQTFNIETPFETNDMYEMSTSFMGGDDEDEDTFSSSRKDEQNEGAGSQGNGKDLTTEDSDTVEWQSESSEDEELSSSSGEFIWKDGNKESKIKAACASDFNSENSLYEKSQSEQSADEKSTNDSISLKENLDENLDVEDDEDDDNESSTGSSASITDFVPSAWNSQATPSRSALRNPDKKAVSQKKNVWFKKQKYHCVYEYPREPSDSEDTEGSPFKQSNFEKNLSETPNKHFNYGVNIVELPNQHFPYGISKVTDFSSYTDWDVVEGDLDLSLTDTDSETGTGKADANAMKKSDINFYNLSPFDYDFNTADLHNGESEFFVSSSSRPFQGGSSIQFLQGDNSQSVFPDKFDTESKTVKSEVLNSKDFITPDSGIEDSINITPLEKPDLNQENLLLKMKNITYPKSGIINILDDINFNFALDGKGSDGSEINFELFGDNSKSKNGLSNSASIPFSNVGLGELKHTKGRLKLDLPRNHNTELGAIINKKNQ